MGRSHVRNIRETIVLRWLKMASEKSRIKTCEIFTRSERVATGLCSGRRADADVEDGGLVDEDEEKLKQIQIVSAARDAIALKASDCAELLEVTYRASILQPL
jgi:hypothetical protein